ncbi:fimbria/pilus outer membrane usher protein [Klebsiella aerogenes]
MFDGHNIIRWYFVILAFPLSSAASDGYIFDPALLRGSVLSNNVLSRFNQQDTISPGNYLVDLYINDQFLEHDEIKFVREGHQVLPCFDRQQLEQFGLMKIPSLPHTFCLMPERDLKGMSVTTDIPALRLYLSIPQALLGRKSRGDINPASLDRGESMAFVNYNLNQYHVNYRQKQQNRDLDSTYINLNGGFNLGLWRYRQQSTYRYDQEFGSHIDTNRRYVQRAILPWRSEMLLGDGFTDGQFFPALGFRGIRLNSDERMLPDSLRGYAPTIRGVAKSNARVTILQGKSTLYETTVSPGPFTINDLYATNYAGDLTVVVTEADGSIVTFTVPFAAVPESIRPGQSRYSAVVAHSRYVGNKDLFSELIWQHGMTNALTFNAGNQFADGYMAMMMGGVYSSWLGAFGMDTTYSHASLPDSTASGWMLHLSYSRTFNLTDTTFSIAGYRYSTEGFRNLGDVLGVRQVSGTYKDWQSDTYQQLSRFDIAINQGMGKLGSLTVSGSTQNYRNQQGRDNQLQLGWGKTFGNGVAINLSIARTRTLRNDDGYYRNYGPQDSIYAVPHVQTTQTVTSLSLSFPLGHTLSAPSISLLANHSQGLGSDYQTTLSGNIGDKEPISYGLNFSTDEKHQQSMWGGNLQTRLPYANVTGSFSSARQYRQGSLSLQGAVVAHRRGVTFGPYVGDTFALIEAPGADGAQVMDGQGSRVDRFGFALAPSLVPYHYNTIALNPEGMNDRVELKDGQRDIAPYAGATVRLRFKTVRGQALLITAQRPDNLPIPMGANVLDAEGKKVGMVGQANQVYLRSSQNTGELILNWGQAPDQQCKLRYQIITAQSSPIQRLRAPCN